MALEKQNITFPFVRGINEKPSERAQAQGELRSAHNITISKIGEFNKRVGFDEESFSDFDGGDAPSQLVDCAAHENELIVFDGEKAYSRYDTGKFKNRGTCVNTRLTQSECNVDSASLDGPPAYCQIKDGTDNEVYEIFVWESRPFGVEDIERNTKSYPNTADTENYRNKPAQLLYSVRHKKTGVFLYDAEPITIDTKKYIDRDLLIASAGVTDYGVYRHAGDTAGQIRVEGYGSSPAIAGRTWADVVANGNQLILEGPFDTGTGTSSKESMFFTDDTYAAVHADYVRVAKLSSSAVDNYADVSTGTSALANVDAYINVDTGDNAFYFTTQPMLFSMTDNVVILTFASQATKGYSDNLGVWSIFQATFDFTSAASAIEAPTILSNNSSGYLDLNYKMPIWDADLCHTTGSKKGITYIYNTNDGTNFTKLQFFEYDSSAKDLDTTPISINVPRADGTTAGQLIYDVTMGTSKAQFGGTAPSGWTTAIVPNRFVLKCINQQSSGSQTNNANNKIVFVFLSDNSKDNDIYVYSTKLSDSAFSSFDPLVAESSIKPLLDRATGSQTWVVPPDLLKTVDIDGAQVTLPTVYDASGDRFQANDLTVVNAAITNVKNISNDAIYLFVEVACRQGGNGATWQNTTTSTSALNTYIRSEDRWIIRKNLANSSDTKVLGRNINILSDAFYAYDGSKAYFAGHSVFDGDMSTARTCLFNEDGEVVGVYASGQSALCHPYELKQMATPVQKYSNVPLFALRSRINSFSDEVFTPTKTGAAPVIADYPLPEFGISVIDNAERAYQYMAPFNPRLASITFFPERTFPSVQQQGTLLVGSGLLWAFNGGKFIENGFLQKPLIQEIKADVASDFSSGGSAVAGASLGKYVVAAAYFYKDENGVSHYSPLDFYGDGATIHEVLVSAASKKLVLQVSNTQITNKRTGITPQTIGYSGTARIISNDIDMSHSSVSIAVFVSASLSETIENRDDLTDIPLQLYKMEPMDTNARFTTISIDSPNKTIQFKDQTTGASPLITSVPVQPSCPTDIAIHRNHVCVSTTDGFVYPSQSFESSLGSEGSSVCPMFAAANVISISEETNGVGASNIESDGQFLMAFNRNNVYAMGGDGPDPVNSANAGTFSPPETIYLDQGIAVGGMAARIPAGVIYQSMHGYYLLSGKSLSFLGAPVEDFTADAYAVQVIDQTNEVVFTTAIRSSSYSPAAMQFLVYNYEVNQWYTWLVPTDTATERATGMQGIMNSNGARELFFCTSSGRVRRQKNSNSSGSTTNQYSDYSLYKPGEAGYYAVESKVKTGQIQIPDFFFGFRLYRIGIPIEIKTAAVLTIKLYYDGSSSAGETFSYTTAGSGYSEIILKPSTQKCRSIAIEIEEDPSSVSAAQGTVLNGIGLLAAPRIVKMAYNTAIAQVPTGS
jgi:hypothetical protein